MVGKSAPVESTPVVTELSWFILCSNKELIGFGFQPGNKNVTEYLFASDELEIFSEGIAELPSLMLCSKKGVNKSE